MPVSLCLLASLAVLTSACNLQPATQALEGQVETAVARTMAAQETLDLPPTAAAADTPQDIIESTEAPSPTARPPVVHQITPGSPNSVSRFVTDVSSASLGPAGSAAGDVYENYLLERPFLVEGMAYQPELDLTRGELDSDLPWYYVSINLAGRPGGLEA